MNQRTVLSCHEGSYRENHSACYRYLLRVALSPLAPEPIPHRRLTVIQKNPSLANAQRSDPTAGKVEAWARRSGFAVRSRLRQSAHSPLRFTRIIHDVRKTWRQRCRIERHTLAYSRAP